jgi:Rrf2 family protein
MIGRVSMKLSTRSRYGTRILVDLARHNNQGPVQIGEISKRQDISVKYLEQLIRPLKQANLVESVRGPKGGHMLAKKPEDITLGQIVRLFEGHTDLVECVSNPEKCNMADDCQVRLAWRDATRVLYEKLDSTTIADLLSGNQNEGR